MVSKPQTPIRNLDEHGLNGGPRLAAGVAADDGGVMAKVIEFYVSDSLPKKSKCIARKEPGKLIEFRSPRTNQANSNSAQWPGMCMMYIAPFTSNPASGSTSDTM
jgi:hypothetical protein